MRIWQSLMHYFFEPKKNRVLVLMDWENLQRDVRYFPDRSSIKERLSKLIVTIAREIGEVVGVYVYLPPHAIFGWGEDLQRLGFWPISCSKIKNKTGEKKDTADSMLIDHGKKLIDQITGLTHLCVGSGDIDMEPLIRSARNKGLKTMLIVRDLQSLNVKLLSLVDARPDGSKLVYTLFPEN